MIRLIGLILKVWKELASEDQQLMVEERQDIYIMDQSQIQGEMVQSIEMEQLNIKQISHRIKGN